MKGVFLLAAIAVSLNVAAVAATPAAPEHSGGAQSVYIEDLTWPEVKAAIIYAGSTEFVPNWPALNQLVIRRLPTRSSLLSLPDSCR